MPFNVIYDIKKIKEIQDRIEGKTKKKNDMKIFILNNKKKIKNKNI